jgi:argininosuccinate synthase
VNEKGKVVLAYSGGLDTSVAVKWIQEAYGLDVVTLTLDLGTHEDLDRIRRRALDVGAVKALVVDAADVFVEYFIWPALRAGAVYERAYPLATALGRPLIAKLLVDTARQEGAHAVAHGCTGKGNDQVRLDVAVKTLAPEMDIIAPAREWKMTRQQEMDYAAQHGIKVDVTTRTFGAAAWSAASSKTHGPNRPRMPSPGPPARPTRRTSRSTLRLTLRRGCLLP